MESTGCNKSGPNPRANHILLFLMDCVLPSAPLAGEEGQFSCNPRMFLTGGEAGSLHFSDQWNYIFETGSWETQPDITDEMSIAKSEAVVDPYNNIYVFGGSVGSIPLENFYRKIGDSWSAYNKDERKWQRFDPNPVAETLTISGIPDYTGDLRISILNVNGQTIRRKAIAAYHHTIRIDVRELPAGLYFLQVESKDWRCYHKIIIR